MDGAPLTLAHEHASRASRETRHGQLSGASVEHERAASQYNLVAQSSCDSEALRTLRLLEGHHRKLAAIIKTKDELLSVATQAKDQDVDIRAEQRSSPDAAEALTPEKQDRPVTEATTNMSLSPKVKAQARTGSGAGAGPPALAKDMASRRGIPSAQYAKVGGPDVSTVKAAWKTTASRADHDAASRLTATTAHSPPRSCAKELNDDHGTDLQTSLDEGFAKFYAAMTTGPLSRLSSMLAFAGLPLPGQDGPEAEQSSKGQTIAAMPDRPEVERYISKAALRAIEEQHRQQGFSGSTFGGAESFYVIPTSGGTASYANIASRTRDKTRQDAAVTSATEPGDTEAEVFVDARETAGTVGGGVGRSSGSKTSGFREEELALENESLKKMLDKLSHRLQAFESHAQDASMAALAPSVSWNRASESHHVRPDLLEERLRVIETQLDRAVREREQLATDNQKQRQIIVKYRDHWEQLKNNARAKEQAKRDAARG